MTQEKKEINEADEDKSRQDAGATCIEKSRQDAGATSSSPKYLSLKIPNPIPHWSSRGYLLHLIVENGTYFVTFRLGDSLPQTVLRQFQREREALSERLLLQTGMMNEHDQSKIEKVYSEKVETYLDAGAGSCVLSKPGIATLTASALQHFAGKRYLLHAWVIMPNHVHVMLTPRLPYSLNRILQSWKSFTAKQINRLLDQEGEKLWQRESYDHLVRSDQEYLKLKEYIMRNPQNAGLCQQPEDWPWLGSAE